MSKVSRSVYQTLKEENNRLLKDIRIMCDSRYNFSTERLKVIIKWNEKFKKEEEFHNLLLAAAKEYLNENPELKKQIELLGKK